MEATGDVCVCVCVCVCAISAVCTESEPLVDGEGKGVRGRKRIRRVVPRAAVVHPAICQSQLTCCRLSRHI